MRGVALRVNAMRPDPAVGGAPTIPALDGLRGIAIFLVLAIHFTPVAEIASLPSWMLQLTDSGWVGVDLFFVLSGFLITGILVDTRSDAHWFRNFYARRALRIFPLYYGFLLVVFGGGALFGLFRKPELGPVWADQWQFWTYTTNFVQAFVGVDSSIQSFLRLSHFWSLAVEEQFYFFWPLLLYWGSVRRLLFTCLVVALTALALRTALWGMSVNTQVLYVFTPCRVDGLALGGAVALMLRDHRFGRERIRRLGLQVVFGAGSALSIIAVMRRGLHYLDPWLATIGYTVLGLFFASLVAVVVTEPEGSRLRRFLSRPWLRSAGVYSYGAYIFHNVVVAIVFRFVPPNELARRFGWGIAWCAAMVIAGAATWTLAYLSYQLYERPFLRLKRFFESTRSAPLQASDPPTAITDVPSEICRTSTTR